MAVVGASIKAGSLGLAMMEELLRGRYEGAIYPVNPGYDEILGRRCYPSVADLPEAVDLAILGVREPPHRASAARRRGRGRPQRRHVLVAVRGRMPDPGRPTLTERLATSPSRQASPCAAATAWGS